MRSARTRACAVLAGERRQLLARLEHRLHRHELALVSVVDGHRRQHRSELPRRSLRCRARLGRRVLARHEERSEDLLRLCVGAGAKPPVDPSARHPQAEQAVAAARERHADGLEGADLLEVVPHSGRERIEELLAERSPSRHPLGLGPGQEEALVRRHRVHELLGRRTGHLDVRDLGGRRPHEGFSVMPVRRVLASQAARAVEVDRHGFEPLVEACRVERNTAVLRDENRPPSKTSPSLPPNKLQ